MLPFAHLLLEEKNVNNLWRNGKPWQAFKNFAILFSFACNLLLLTALLLAAPLIIPSLAHVALPLVRGLNQSFADMSAASIERTIFIRDQLPVAFDLPLNQETAVLLTEPVPMSVPATFILPAGGGTINGTVTLQLPAGLRLPTQINLTVPVSTSIPINMDVPVLIPLHETELGRPFAHLQALFTPLEHFLGSMPASNDDLMERLNGSSREVLRSESTAEVSGRK